MDAATIAWIVIFILSTIGFMFGCMADLIKRKMPKRSDTRFDDDDLDLELQANANASNDDDAKSDHIAAASQEAMEEDNINLKASSSDGDIRFLQLEKEMEEMNAMARADDTRPSLLRQLSDRSMNFFKAQPRSPGHSHHLWKVINEAYGSPLTRDDRASVADATSHGQKAK
jgi:hypothetical protein